MWICIWIKTWKLQLYGKRACDGIRMGGVKITSAWFFGTSPEADEYLLTRLARSAVSIHVHFKINIRPYKISLRSNDPFAWNIKNSYFQFCPAQWHTLNDSKLRGPNEKWEQNMKVRIEQNCILKMLWNK